MMAKDMVAQEDIDVVVIGSGMGGATILPLNYTLRRKFESGLRQANRGLAPQSSFGSTGAILPSRPTQCLSRRAQRRSRMARVRATAGGGAKRP